MMLIEQYDVLEKPLNQNFEKCNGSGSTLVVFRIDVIALICVRLAKKKVAVRCNHSGKNISKRYWNEETRAEAKKLLEQHQTPKLGYIILAIILVICFTGMISSFFKTI